MRTASGVVLSAAAAMGILALMPARAGAPVTIEKSLLGVRILQTYHDVLAKWGQPTLVLRGGEKFLYTPTTDAEGNDLGGIKGVSYEGGASTSGGGGGGMGGMGGGPIGMRPGGSGGMGMQSAFSSGGMLVSAPTR